MQYFDRTPFPPPAVYRGSAAQEERRELLAFMSKDRESMAQTTPSSSHFSLANDEILTSLNQMFRGKCAFCESKTVLDVHLLRPPEEAEPLARSEFAHLYYAWLRTDWGNAYPICMECARTGRRQFPVAKSDRGPLPTVPQLEGFANENSGLWRSEHKDKPLIIDPCRERRFARHFSFSRDGGIQAFTRAGAQTIAVFNLDREALAKSRSRAFDDYISMLTTELDRGIEPNGLEFPSLEFGGAWYLLLHRVLDLVGQRLQQALAPSPSQVPGALKSVWRMQVGRDALIAAFEEVGEPVKKATIGRPAAKGEVRRLAAVTAKNFKAIENLTLSIPPPIVSDANLRRDAEAAAVLVLGENATGKSSILEAIALALADQGARDRLRRPPQNFILDPELMGAPQVRQPDGASVELAFADGSKMQLSIRDSFVEAGTTNNLPPVFAYGAFRQYAAGSPKKQSKDRITTLFRSEVLLSNPEAWLLGLPDDQFARVIRALQKIFVVEGDFEVVRRDHANSRCLIVSRVGDGANHREIVTPLAVVSSGFRSVLAMVCDVLAGVMKLQGEAERSSFDTVDAVLLVDELEAHLHPRWKMQIMAALRRVFPKATIVATTHDPLCLRGMHDQEVVVLNRGLRSPDEVGDLPIVVEALARLPNVEGLTVEQLLTSDFFAMFSTDSPVMERQISKLSDLAARQARGESLSPADLETLEEMKTKIVDALPLGSSEVQRLVQDAVLGYLQQRRTATASRLERLKADTRTIIMNALGGY